jgi:hypothetical protein
MKSEHWLDENDNPAGGSTFGNGFAISWQNGPLGGPNDPERKDPNGAFVEDIIKAAIDRIEFFQNGKFNCAANDETLTYLREALASQYRRTNDRLRRGVEGTHAD